MSGSWPKDRAPSPTPSWWRWCWAPADAIDACKGVGAARAAAVAAAFELGRRRGWSPPRRGERCLDPRRVHELLRHAAHAEREGFHVAGCATALDYHGGIGGLSADIVVPVVPGPALSPTIRGDAVAVIRGYRPEKFDGSNHPVLNPLRMRSIEDRKRILVRASEGPDDGLGPIDACRVLAKTVFYPGGLWNYVQGP